MLTSARIMVVVYRHPAFMLERLVRSVPPAVRVAQARGGAHAVDVAIGDCSPEPVLDGAAVERLSGHLAPDARLHYDYFGENLGSSGGNNRLAAGAGADVLIVLNPDTYLSPRSLDRLLAAVNEPEVGVADGRQIPVEHPKWYDPLTGETSWASGCCLAIRRDVFEEIGGFDDLHFPLYCNDVDLSWRVRMTGRRAIHVPDAPVFHDRRIDPGGWLVASPSEDESSVFGRLMLATRYGRPDIVEETLARVDRHGSDADRRGVAMFRDYRRGDMLPEPIDGAAAVAQFVDGQYAVHRR
jgi:hypothetical protein